jgi:hypothetical protein
MKLRLFRMKKIQDFLTKVLKNFNISIYKQELINKFRKAQEIFQRCKV